MKDQSNQDLIVEEIHRTRERISDRFQGSIRAIAEDAEHRRVASGRPVWMPRPSPQVSQPRSGAMIPAVDEGVEA